MPKAELTASCDHVSSVILNVTIQDRDGGSLIQSV